jgi:hypothetical protein
MNFRKITSLTMLLSFVTCILTSVILYIVPEGRIAYWSDWRLWGLTKAEWGSLHLNLGLLFLIAGVFHLFYNWSVIAAYLRNKAKTTRVFTASFNVALLLTLVVGLGTYWKVPPLSSVLDFGHYMKDAAAKKYGEPPYAHAELSPLSAFMKKTEVDPVKAMALLTKAGIIVDNDKQTVAAIAVRNRVTPKTLLDIIKPANSSVETKAMVFPDEPFPGFGNKVLSEICIEYNLQSALIIQGLAKENITAQPEQTVRQIAGAAGMDPHAFFALLHRVVMEQNKESVGSGN